MMLVGGGSLVCYVQKEKQVLSCLLGSKGQFTGCKWDFIAFPAQNENITLTWQGLTAQYHLDLFCHGDQHATRCTYQYSYCLSTIFLAGHQLHCLHMNILLWCCFPVLVVVAGCQLLFLHSFHAIACFFLACSRPSPASPPPPCPSQSLQLVCM